MFFIKKNNLYGCIQLITLCIVIGLSGCNSGSTAVSSVNTSTIYTAFACPGTINVSFPGVSGIRGVDGSDTDVYVTGNYVQYGSPHAFLYTGPILGGGICTRFNYPTSPGNTVTSTSLYGPDNGNNGSVVLVGSYTNAESGNQQQHGLLYQGSPDGIHGTYTTLSPNTLDPINFPILGSESSVSVIAHSTMNNLVVGAMNTTFNEYAFIYNIDTGRYQKLGVGLITTTPYGIWYNGGTSYTIVGGYSDVVDQGRDVGFIVNYDPTKNIESIVDYQHVLPNFESINYLDLPGSVVGTHVEGITTDGNGGYNLAVDGNYIVNGDFYPALANISVNNGVFSTITWYPFNLIPGSSFTSANTVYKNNILGLYTVGNYSYGYVATIKLY